MFGSNRSEVIRSRVTLDEIEGLQIIIPPVRSRFMRLFLGLWLVGWAFGELGAVGALIGMGLGFAPHFPNNLPVFFLVFWLVAWTVGGIFALDTFIWQSRGHESIRIDPDGETLVVRRPGTLIPRRTRTYPLDRVRSLRFAPVMMPFSPFAIRAVLGVPAPVGRGRGRERRLRCQRPDGAIRCPALGDGVAPADQDHQGSLQDPG